MSHKFIYKLGARSEERDFCEIMQSHDYEEAEKLYKEILVWYEGSLELVILKEHWQLVNSTPVRVSQPKPQGAPNDR